MRRFFDTNIFVYLFDCDEPSKRGQAEELVKEAVSRGEALLSIQVLQEFYVTVTRKLAVPLPAETAYRVLQDLSALPIVRIDEQTVLLAAGLSHQHSLSFWDALIVQAAIEGGARVLFSEDMQHDRTIGNLRIINPFR